MPATGAGDHLLGEVRQLVARVTAGGREALDAFHDLATAVLTTTVLAQSAALRLYRGPRGQDTAMLGSFAGPTEPLPLTDGRFLRLRIALSLVQENNKRRTRTETSSLQYQLDPAGTRWVFRYDYSRFPTNKYPAAHVQLRGVLLEECLPGQGTALEHVHLPTGRVSLEAIIRLLIETFKVPPRTTPNVWRPLLALSERAFLDNAHQPLSGPDR